MAEVQGVNIRPAQLIELYEIGFKPVPLGEDGKPVMPWTPIYENPEYWTHEKLIQEAPKFRNGVATVLGKTRFEDEKGCLYLNCLDIDSKEVYKILLLLENPPGGFIPFMQNHTVVVKTRKANGFHIYWLSHKEHKPIHSTDCKPGFEFEIKTDNTSGHCTLPPSRHREDRGFQYKNFDYDQKQLYIKDDLYDFLIHTLKPCMKSKNGDVKRENKKSYSDIEKAEIQIIAECIQPYYRKPHRNDLVLGLSGLFHKYGVSEDSTKDLIQMLAKDDNISDRRNAEKIVEETFGKDASIVAGSRYLLDALVAAVGDNGVAKDILDKIFRTIGKGDIIQWLTRSIMNEYTFKTTTDNEDIYCYDTEKGVFVSGQEWRIKALGQLMYPYVTTHQLSEIINQVKRRTYLDRNQFDSDIDILNLQNGLLNMITGEFKEHTPDHLSLVQLPVKYDATAKCPNITRFLRQVLRPKNTLTVFEMFGYCLYRSAKYEKAVMCVGKGQNGKSTFLQLFQCFLGPNNISHASLQELNGDRFAVAELSHNSARCKYERSGSVFDFVADFVRTFVLLVNCFHSQAEFTVLIVCTDMVRHNVNDNLSADQLTVR
jgi:D5 N terminal like